VFLPGVKLYASSLVPARCPKCGELAGIVGWVGLTTALAEFTGITLLIGGSSIATAISIAAIFAVPTWLFGLVGTLSPIAASNVLRSRVVAGIVGALFVAGGMFALFARTVLH
jgi:hypothetical protein